MHDRTADDAFMDILNSKAYTQDQREHISIGMRLAQAAPGFSKASIDKFCLFLGSCDHSEEDIEKLRRVLTEAESSRFARVGAENADRDSASGQVHKD